MIDIRITGGPLEVIDTATALRRVLEVHHRSDFRINRHTDTTRGRMYLIATLPPEHTVGTKPGSEDC